VSQHRSLALPFLLAVAAPVFAQSVNATLRGTVHDASGASIPGAVIVVTNTEKGEKRTTTTNSNGDFTVTQLPAQEYSISVSAPNFRTVVNDHFVLQVSQEARFDPVLSIGDVSENVEVNTGSPLIQTEDSLNGAVIDEAKIKQLPTNSRNFWQLAQLDPNVSATTASSSLQTRGGFVVAGMPDTTNNYLLDGADDNDWTTNQPTVRPSLDAIREFRIISSLAPAEYGRHSGGQILLSTKSGTNNVHGSFFGFYRTGKLNARNYFTTTANPPYNSKQLGGSIGGPIWKNKSFFFASYEGTFTAFSPGVQLSFPNTQYLNAATTGDFSFLGTQLTDPVTGNKVTKFSPSSFSAVSLALLKYFPATQTQTVANNYTNNVSNTSNAHQITFRVDQRLSNKQNIAGEYTVLTGQDTGTSGDFTGASTSPNFGVIGPHTYQHASFTDDYVFTPHILNEFRGGFNRMDAGYLNQDQKYGNVVAALGLPQGGANGLQSPDGGNIGVPYVSIAGFSTIGLNNDPQWRGDNTVNITDGLTWVKGNHSFKVGVDYFNFFKHSFFVSTGRGSFAFTNTTYTGNAYADFLLGYISSDSYGTGNEQQFPRQRAWAGYIQDEWKVSRSLTLNYGLRYEYFAQHTEGYNRISKFDSVQNAVLTGAGQTYTVNNSTGLLQVTGTNPTFKTLYEKTPTDFAPRFGFAYRVNGSDSTVIRGGFGVYYNLVAVQTWNSATALGAPFLLSKSFTGTKTAPLTWSSPFGSIQAVGGVGVTTINPVMPRPNTNTYSLGIQHQFRGNTLVEVSYQGSKGSHFVTSPAINNPTLAARIAAPTATIQSLRPYNNIGSKSNWGAISLINPGGATNYNSLLIRAEKRYSNGLNFLSYLVYAKSLDNVSTPQDPQNPSREWGPSDYDQKLRFVTSGYYDLPFGRGRKWLSDSHSIPGAIVGGWQVSTVATLQGGRPFTVTTTDAIASNTGASDRAFAVPGQNPNAATDSRTGANTHTVTNWFNSGAFRANDPANASPAATTVFNYGTASRNSLRGPGLQNVDFGLDRHISLRHEHTNLEFRADVFNILNHPNFGNPASSYSSTSTLGTISTTVGSNLATATGANRQLQFALRINY
jgi:hypothetical protein